MIKKSICFFFAIFYQGLKLKNLKFLVAVTCDLKSQKETNFFLEFCNFFVLVLNGQKIKIMEKPAKLHNKSKKISRGNCLPLRWLYNWCLVIFQRQILLGNCPRSPTYIRNSRADYFGLPFFLSFLFTWNCQLLKKSQFFCIF